MSYYHVRINKTRKNVYKDFVAFEKSMCEDGKAIWDKDSKNKMDTGDYIGFIVDDVDNTEKIIKIYKILACKEERDPNWNTTEPYNADNGTSSVGHRHVIVLANDPRIPANTKWNDFRKCTGLGKDCKSWMPRGTQKVKDKQKINHWLPELYSAMQVV